MIQIGCVSVLGDEVQSGQCELAVIGVQVASDDRPIGRQLGVDDGHRLVVAVLQLAGQVAKCGCRGQFVGGQLQDDAVAPFFFQANCRKRYSPGPGVLRIFAANGGSRCSGFACRLALPENLSSTVNVATPKPGPSWNAGKSSKSASGCSGLMGDGQPSKSCSVLAR